MENAKVISRAFRFALIAHEGQKRKGTEIPYIVHPLEVAIILMENGALDFMVAAGLLHDTLEDTPANPEILRKYFGEKILSCVLGASEVLENRDRIPWKDRKNHTVRFLADAPRDVKIISCADKLSNIRSVFRENPKGKDNFWNRFNAGYEDQRWYYESLVKSLSDLEGLPMFEEFKSLVHMIFGERGPK